MQIAYKIVTCFPPNPPKETVDKDSLEGQLLLEIARDWLRNRDFLGYSDSPERLDDAIMELFNKGLIKGIIEEVN